MSEWIYFEREFKRRLGKRGHKGSLEGNRGRGAGSPYNASESKAVV